jgi:hypothetical protein
VARAVRIRGHLNVTVVDPHFVHHSAGSWFIDNARWTRTVPYGATAPCMSRAFASCLPEISHSPPRATLTSPVMCRNHPRQRYRPDGAITTLAFRPSLRPGGIHKARGAVFEETNIAGRSPDVIPLIIRLLRAGRDSFVRNQRGQSFHRTYPQREGGSANLSLVVSRRLIFCRRIPEVVASNGPSLS